MTTTPSSLGERSRERGSALIAVLLLLMMMSALVAALSTSSQTETFVSRNQKSGAQAQAAAEAGLNHAVELAVAYIFNWKANGFGSVDTAVSGLLAGPDGDPATIADNTSLGARGGIDAGAAIPLGAQLTIGGAPSVSYEAIVMDDDASAPGAGVYAENGDLYTDLNQRVLIRATGHGPDNSKVVLEALLGPISLPAIVTEGDLEISGNVAITSAVAAAAHSNANLTVDGKTTNIVGTVTATGDWIVTDPDLTGNGGVAAVPIPEVNAADYLGDADFKLTKTGTMIDMATGAVVCAASPCNGWTHDGGGNWSITEAPTQEGAYYVEGTASLSGSPGTAKNPIALSVIAEGSISITGSPKLKPGAEDILFITNGDLKITGSLDILPDEEEIIDVQGKMLAHEQIDLGGNVSVLGLIVAEDATNNSNLVTDNHIHGNVEIQYFGGLFGEVYSVTGWRDVRDAD